jgi:hypothetical protein
MGICLKRIDTKRIHELLSFDVLRVTIYPPNRKLMSNFGNCIAEANPNKIERAVRNKNVLVTKRPMKMNQDAIELLETQINDGWDRLVEHFQNGIAEQTGEQVRHSNLQIKVKESTRIGSQLLYSFFYLCFFVIPHFFLLFITTYLSRFLDVLSNWFLFGPLLVLHFFF